MSKVETDVFYFKSDVGKNLYRKRTYYTLVVEQDVLANDKDEADTLLTDGGGINHDKVNKELTDTNKGVETYMVDANYTDSDTTQYIGKVKYDDEWQDLKEAVECEDVHIDSYASEDEPLQVIPMTEAEEDKNAGVTRDSDNNVKGVEYGV